MANYRITPITATMQAASPNGEHDNTTSKQVDTLVQNLLDEVKNLRREVQTLKAAGGSVSQDIDKSQGLSSTQLNTEKGPAVGYVRTALPHLGWYHVVRSVGQGYLPCCDSTGAWQPMTTTEYKSYPPGTTVIYQQLEGLNYGVILGVLPPVNQDATLSWSSPIAATGGSGFKNMPHYAAMLSNPDIADALTDFSGNRPYDQTCYDVGYTTPLGGKLHLDPFLILLQTSDNCGLQLFQLDSLARLSGDSLEVQSSVKNSTEGRDEKELYGETEHYLFPWEQLGFTSPVIVAETQPSQVQGDDLEYLVQCALSTGQELLEGIAPISRVTQYDGYLGQGLSTWIRTGPQSLTSIREGISLSEQAALSGDTLPSPIGLMSKHEAVDGTFGVQSASAIYFTKKPVVPFVKRVKEPSDTEGDSLQSGYAFSGLDYEYSTDDEGNTKVTAVTPKHKAIPFSVDDARAWNTSAVAAGFFNWTATHPFSYHEKDFEFVNNKSLFTDPESYSLPWFNELQRRQELDAPPVFKVDVGGSTGIKEYSQSSAFFGLMPDGSFCLRDAFGAEIRSDRGNLTISAPGDITLLPGRSLVAMTGDDVVIKAHNSVDITGETGDVRMAARVNMELLSGTDGYGRLLLENRSAGLPTMADFTLDDGGLPPNEDAANTRYGEDILGRGIHIVCPSSLVTTTAEGTYQSLRLQAHTEVREGYIQNSCRSMYTTADNRCMFSIAASGSDAVNELSLDRYQTYTRGSLTAGQSISSGDNVFAGNSFFAYNGHIYTGRCTENPEAYLYVYGMGRNVSELMESRVANTERFVRLDTSMNEARQAAEDAFDRYYTEDGGVATLEYKAMNTFCFRTDVQYGTVYDDLFTLGAPYWMTLYVESPVGGCSPWTSQDMITTTFGEQQQTSYPGLQAWSQSNGLFYPSETARTLSNGVFDTLDKEVFENVTQESLQPESRAFTEHYYINTRRS